MTEYRKLKCASCDNEVISKAKKPRCQKCGSVRFNEILQLSAIEEHEKQQEQPKPEPIIEPVPGHISEPMKDLDAEFYGD